MAALKPIKQSDPPPMKRKTGPRGSKYDPVIEQLKATPGQWFLVCEDVTTTTSRVFKINGCKTTTRAHEGSLKPHRVDVWAMWPAEDEAENQSSPASKKEAPAKDVQKIDVPKKDSPKKALAKKVAPKKFAAKPRPAAKR